MALLTRPRLRNGPSQAQDGFVVFDAAKGVLDAASSLGEAEEQARYYARRDKEPGFGVDANTRSRRVQNPGNPPPLVLNRLKPLDPEAVFQGGPEKSLVRAYESLAHYFPRQVPYVDLHGEQRSGRGYAPYGPGTRRTLADILYDGILKQNAKLEKTQVTGAELPAIAYGLSLIPATMATTIRDSNGDSILPTIVGDKHPADWNEASAFAASLRPKHSFNLCPFATDECKRSCLVKTGQNDEVNNYSKLLMTYALQSHPAAFVRLLVAALDRYFFEPMKKIRFIRLNVYSDILWEQFVPWLFERYMGAGHWPERTPRSAGSSGRGLAHAGYFYDYTKVAARIGQTPENYDLTFSYSGDEQNFRESMRFLAEGRARVAAVFLRGKKEWSTRIFPGKKRTNYRFMGYPLVNGDRHDFRPYDPNGVWVALRWKSPKGFVVSEKEAERARAERGRGGKVMPAEVIRKFVIKATIKDGEWLAPVQPNKTPSLSVV